MYRNYWLDTCKPGVCMLFLCRHRLTLLFRARPEQDVPHTPAMDPPCRQSWGSMNWEGWHPTGSPSLRRADQGQGGRKWRGNLLQFVSEGGCILQGFEKQGGKNVKKPLLWVQKISKFFILWKIQIILLRVTSVKLMEECHRSAQTTSDPGRKTNVLIVKTNNIDLKTWPVKWTHLFLHEILRTGNSFLWISERDVNYFWKLCPIG